ncbi:bifunctional diaminohydroxyphosphoribosylaminopyrimidine deaminase/5-amino-6-(5-phosphoribosylamino)uracil reductase RibD [Gordonia sp. (in: high G+C Gram-positive bacteria)]|uniref:bifunctional diaminohydroxyphosphoribosylaminopyrimidine deaminase/5-amino-6-(5-phosphoribosylamino)uracil reductase RibD n=1 Tax=Gordonia sp. (in: high G+C Gram-positive bacteria) TaxID=84139 RepID=UPI003C730306
MLLAIAVSADAQGISTPNPPVGAVILDRGGEVAGVGYTQPPGGPHAEVVALREAGERARGGTAIVTLEPCNHTGRTGPCAEALIDAGIAEVRFAVADPNPAAAGGAATLRAAGIRVEAGVGEHEARSGPLKHWLFRQQHGRPFVTAKIAATLDGRIAAPDGTSQWITGPSAREHAHRQRSQLDAIVVGTGTVLADNPSLTARHPDGSLAQHQPIRVVLGRRQIPATATVRDGVSPLLHIASREPREVIEALPDALHILVEGGPAIIGAFLAADLVDEVQAYLAPTILGAGRAAVTDVEVTTLTQAHGFTRTAVRELGDDLLVTLGARTESPTGLGAGRSPKST